MPAGWRRSPGPEPRAAPTKSIILLVTRHRSRATVCLPTHEIARRARSYIGMAQVGQRRSGSHPRSAPGYPAIADKVRYGEKHRASRQPVGAGPARDFARRARSYIGMVRVGQRSGSHPRSAPIPPAIADKVRSYGEKHRASRQPGAGPARDFARRARSYIGMARVGQRRSGSHPRSAPIPPAIADKVRYREEYRASRQPVIGWTHPHRGVEAPRWRSKKPPTVRVSP